MFQATRRLTPRRLIGQVTELLGEVPAVVLVAPRQVGKTTLALELGDRLGATYLDLESEADLGKLTEQERYLSRFLDWLGILDGIHTWRLSARTRWSVRAGRALCWTTSSPWSPKTWSSSSTGPPGPRRATSSSGVWAASALLSNGIVWAWGRNTCGQPGDGTTTNRYSPVQVADLGAASVVSAGDGHVCALKTDQTTWCWGANRNG